MTINRKVMDKAKATARWANVMSDEVFMDILASWHGGQNDPIYAVSSSLYAGSPEYLTKAIVRDAIYNLRLTQKQLAKKHYKGYTRADIAGLKYVIQMLELVYTAMPDDGSEGADEDFYTRR